MRGRDRGWSLVRGLTGHLDATNIKKPDNLNRIDTFPVLIEVRSVASAYCGTWQINIQANTGATAIVNCLPSE